MIQRIQTAYLFIVCVLIMMLFFFPIVKVLIGDDNIYYLFFNGVKSIDPGNQEMIYSTWPLLVIILIILLISVVSVFLYKRRIFQIRLCVYNIFLLVGVEILIFYYALLFKNKFDAIIHYSFPVVIPVISIILTYLAFRGIKKDVELLRSYDRIR